MHKNTRNLSRKKGTLYIFVINMFKMTLKFGHVIPNSFNRERIKIKKAELCVRKN